ncbi:MAG: hypothetical protein KatS3mg051_2090 [Anaerolineae bacterium]|nr:MAG: hypothetical protein KatS3mg051_2090 [Anaerolineae bacterium]
MYYIIETQYVGPSRYGINPITRHHYDITTEPGTTNMSHEIRTDGWLGTTNDWSRHAHGEYETLEKARKALLALLEDRHGEYHKAEEIDTLEAEFFGLVERYYPTRYRTVCDAADWLAGIGDDDRVREELGITAETTDAELEEIAQREQQTAYEDEQMLLDGLMDYLVFLRASSRTMQDL